MESTTRTSSDPGDLRIQIDRNRCQGRARCVAIAPWLFELDEAGQARASGNGTVPPDFEEEAWLAEAYCPANAIRVCGQAMKCRYHDT